MPTLKNRFESFMAVFPGVENIDSLMKFCSLSERQRADYLAFGRRAIIEQKSVEVDLHAKVRGVIDKFVCKHGPVTEKQIGLYEFAAKLGEVSEGNEIKSQLRQILTQRIDDVLAKADKQTADTRKTFLIPDAVGIAVILNDDVQLIEPDFVVDKAFDMLRKRLPNGELRYPQNEAVIVISEAHRIQADHDGELIPTETILSEAGAQNQLLTGMVDTILQCWAKFNGADFRKWDDMARTVRTRDEPKNFPTQ